MTIVNRIERTIAVVIIFTFALCVAYAFGAKRDLVDNISQETKVVSVITHQAIVKPLVQVLRIYSKLHGVQINVRVADNKKLHSMLLRKGHYHVDHPIIIWPDNGVLSLIKNIKTENLWTGQLVVIVPGQDRCFTRKCRHISDLLTLVCFLKKAEPNAIAILDNADIVNYQLLREYERLMQSYCGKLYHRGKIDRQSNRICPFAAEKKVSYINMYLNHDYGALPFGNSKNIVYQDAEISLLKTGKSSNRYRDNFRRVNDFCSVLQLHELEGTAISFGKLSAVNSIRMLQKRCFSIILNNKKWLYNLLEKRVKVLGGNINKQRWKILFALESDIDDIGVRMLPQDSIRFDILMGSHAMEGEDSRQLRSFLSHPDAQASKLLAQHGLQISDKVID